ncbi:MAG: hypothetical protein IPG90_05100 [Bacteroidetes bacterium]|nr:hypothetical protein [Bacteroidota bacterium]
MAKGSGEETGLETNSVNWLLMGSSFHWVDFRKGLEEFQRVLMPGGFFTAIWNPRNLEVSELHTSIENQIRQFVPSLKRVSSGSGEFTKTLSRALASSGIFTDVVYMEQEYDVLQNQSLDREEFKINDDKVRHKSGDITGTQGEVKNCSCVGCICIYD